VTTAEVEATCIRHMYCTILYNTLYNVLHSQFSTNRCRVVGDSQNEAKGRVQRVRHVPTEPAIHQVDDKVPYTPKDGYAFVKDGVVVVIN
jgi:hypothetical protein